MADSLSLAMLVVLENWRRQRTVLLLRDVFDEGYGEMAGSRGQEQEQRPPAREPGAQAHR